jgi:peptidoglycan hydrolase CwlO-like protein
LDCTCGIFLKEIMSLQDNLSAAQADVQSVHNELDKVNAVLNAAQAAVDSFPHLSVLAEIEGFVNHIPAELNAEFTALIAKARSLF